MFESLPLALYEIADHMRGAGLPVYLVGHAVRNGLMSLPCREFNLTGPARPEEVALAFRDKPGYRLIPSAPRYGRIDIGLQEQNRWVSAEYTTFRKDSYRIGHRSNAPEFTDSLEVDACSRDYTINAIYWDMTRRTLIDPTGGRGDIENRVLRATAVDPIAMLGEDALRLLRLVRLSSELRFDIEDGLWISAQRMASRLLDVDPERIRDEWLRILLSDARYPMLGDDARSVGAGLHRLVDMRALPTFMPGWEAAVEGSIDLCAATPPVLTARLAALLHRGRGAAAVRGLLGPTGLHCPREVTDRVSRLIDLSAMWRGTATAQALDALFAQEGYATSYDLVALREAVDRTTGAKDAALWRQRLERRRLAREADPPERPAFDGALLSRLAGESASGARSLKRRMTEHLRRHPEDNHPDALIDVLMRPEVEGTG